MEFQKNHSITISDQNGELHLDLTDGLNWTTACLMLFSTIDHLANQTVNIVCNNIPGTSRDEVAADIADMINYAASNVLNKLSPKDPDLELSEVAIATMENIIIQNAAKRHITIKEALKEYEEELSKSPYAVKPFGQNSPKSSNKEVIPMKKKGGKGGKGGCK